MALHRWPCIDGLAASLSRQRILGRKDSVAEKVSIILHHMELEDDEWVQGAFAMTILLFSMDAVVNKSLIGHVRSRYSVSILYIRLSTNHHPAMYYTRMYTSDLNGPQWKQNVLQIDYI